MRDLIVSVPDHCLSFYFGMSRPGIEPVTSHSLERTLYQLSYRGRLVIEVLALFSCTLG